MLSSAATATLNHLLAQADWARVRLREHAGAAADLTVGGRVLRLGIAADGYFCAPAPDTAPSVTIVLDPAALAKLPDGVDAAMSQVKISGQADLADTLEKALPTFSLWPVPVPPMLSITIRSLKWV